MVETQSYSLVEADSPLSLNLGKNVSKLDESISVVKMVTEDILRDPSWDHHLLELDLEDESLRQDETAIIYHSSGSTGMPKSIATSHAKLLSPIPTGKGTRTLTSSPLCHAFASKLTINAMMAGKCMYLTSATAALTTKNLVDVFRAASPDVFLTVPYMLKLLAESSDGIDVLRQCKQVVSSGSMLSDELGYRLVEEGVNVETLFAG